METQQISGAKRSYRALESEDLTGMHLSEIVMCGYRGRHSADTLYYLTTSHLPSTRGRTHDPWFEMFRPQEPTLGIGEPDPAAAFVELQDELASAKTITARASALIREVEQLLAQVREVHERQEAEEALAEDVVVYGEPNRRTHRQGKIVRKRRAQPLLVAEDFSE